MTDKSIQHFDTHCIVRYNNIQSKLTFPTSDYQFYAIGPHEDTDYDWYDSLNSYCIEKQPTEEKILVRLYKYVDKQNVIGIKKHTATKIIPTASAQLKSIDTYDVSYYRLKEKLTSFAESSKFLTTEFAPNENIKSIYNEKILANILVEEYLKCWESMKQFGLTLELINDNVFSWKLKFDSFEKSDLTNDLDRLHRECGLKHVEVDIFFHGKLYPNYPPVVRVIKPTFMNQLSHRISNSKMVQLSYWTPSRSVMYIVSRLHHLLNTWGRIDFGEAIEHVSYSPALLEFDSNLQKLSSFIDPVKQDDEIDSDEEFISFNLLSKTTVAKPKSTTTSKTGWKAGTGYGTRGSSNWDPKEFIKLQLEKDTNVSIILGKIIDNLYTIQPAEYKQMSEIISRSLLVSYLKQQFTSVSLLDVKTRLSIYKLCFNIISELIHEETMNLFAIKYENSSDTLYDVLLKLYDLLKTTQSIGVDENEHDDKEIQYLEFETMIVNTIEVMLIPLYQEYKLMVEQKTSTNTTIVPTVSSDVRQQYIDTMSKFKFKRAEILNTNFKPDFKAAYEKALGSGANFNECRKRLRVEIPTFKQDGSLPIEYDSSIFVRVDESNPMIIRMLVTGPKDTPYDSGCMIFDFYTPETYPTNCPSVKFMNHGNKRFNPNLYECGKVCLSVLGQSYVGPSAASSERWNETSNLLNVMVSIQSQILIEDPYFNEPGHEGSMGTASGDSSTKLYNENIRQYVMDSAMLALLENPKSYPQFEDVIINHFKLKRDYISSVLDKWTADAMNATTKTKMTKTSERIKTLMAQL